MSDFVNTLGVAICTVYVACAFIGLTFWLGEKIWEALTRLMSDLRRSPRP